MAETVLHLNKRRASVTQGNLLARSVQPQMTVYENRLIYVAMAAISRDQTDFFTTEIPVTALERLLGLNTKIAYKIAEDTALSLFERTALIGSDAEGWMDAPWFSRASYIPGHKHPKRVSTIQLMFHEELKPYLLQQHLLQQQGDFNTIPLRELLSIPTFTSARVFEVFYHDSSGGQKAFLTYDLEDFKKRIGLEGKYTRFGDFRYVLERARIDLAAHTSLTFSYVGIQRGRGYAQIRFQIMSNTSYTPLEATSHAPLGNAQDTDTAIGDESLRLEDELRTAGYTLNPSATIAKYGTERVRDNLIKAQEKACEAAISSNPIRNLGGLITYMIENDIAGKYAQVDEEELHTLSTQELHQLATLLKDGFEADLRRASGRLQAAMTEAELDELHDIMRVELGKYTLAELDKRNWRGASYEAALNTMLYQKRRSLFPSPYHSLITWTNHEGLFSEYSPEDRNLIIGAARALLQGNLSYQDV